MERRLFLQSLLAASISLDKLLATAVLDPERLLWVPGRTFFIPPVPRFEFIPPASIELIRSFDRQQMQRITRMDAHIVWMNEKGVLHSWK